MKKLLSLIGVAIATVINCSAQNPTNASSLLLSGATNWAAVPYGIYRVDTKDWGYGGALLYRVSDNFWTGLRLNNISGQQVTAGLQAQLQTTFTYAGIQFTPFVEASTGLGHDALYGSAGPGAYVVIHSWNFNVQHHDFSASVGVVGDYEHVIYGSQNWNQFCGGPLLRVSF